MYEGLTPSDDFGETGEFDEVINRTVPSVSIPVGATGQDMVLTPANTTVRLFSNGQDEYSRVIIHLEDGTSAPFKPDESFIHDLVSFGFPVESPEAPDETDKEFLAEFMRVWTEDFKSEIGIA